MHIARAVIAAVLVCTAASARAQDSPQTPATDNRTQYPKFMENSFFSFSVGAIGYLFGERQLEPGFKAETVDKPRLAVRVDLFGHRFTST